MSKWKRAYFCPKCFGHATADCRDYSYSSSLPRVCPKCGEEVGRYTEGARRRTSYWWNPFRRYEERVPGKPEPKSDHEYSVTISGYLAPDSPYSPCEWSWRTGGPAKDSHGHPLGCSSSGSTEQTTPAPKRKASKKKAKKKRTRKAKQ